MITIQKEVYDAFLAAGVPEEKADAAARALARNPDDMATKTDLAELEARLTWRMVTLTGLILTAIAALAIFK